MRIPPYFFSPLLQHPQLPTYVVRQLAVFVPIVEKHQTIPECVDTFLERVASFPCFVTSHDCLSYEAQQELFHTKYGEDMYILLAE